MSVSSIRVKDYADMNQVSISEARLILQKRDRIERLDDIQMDLEINGSVNSHENMEKIVQLLIELMELD